jgi:hypothetical protein
VADDCECGNELPGAFKCGNVSSLAEEQLASH